MASSRAHRFALITLLVLRNKAEICFPSRPIGPRTTPFNFMEDLPDGSEPDIVTIPGAMILAKWVRRRRAASSSGWSFVFVGCVRVYGKKAARLLLGLAPYPYTS